MKKYQKAFGSMVFIGQILMGLPVLLFGYLAYLIFPPPDQPHIPYKNSIRIIIHNVLPNFFVKIANSLLFLIQKFSFILITNLKRILRRNIFNFNRVSIFAFFIVFISIFSFNVNYLYSLNTIYNDDCLICDTGYDGIDDVSNLSVYDVYRVPSNDLLIVIVPIKNVFINPYDLTFKISTRSPPA
jgi:hypothetical protein